MLKCNFLRKSYFFGNNIKVIRDIMVRLRFDQDSPPTIVDVIKHIVQANFLKSKNFFMLITGDSGSGKSYAAMTFAEAIDKDFSPTKQVIYFPEDFERVFDYVKNNGKRVIIFDEAHVTMPSRRWHALTNLALNQIMATFRQLRQVAVFVVAPTHNAVDKQVRELFHYICILEKVLDAKEKQAVYANLYEIVINRFDLRDQIPFMRKVYFLWNGGVWKLGPMKVPLPSQRVINEYENISMPFKQHIFDTRIKMLTGKKEVKDGVAQAD
jgi:energy-coupling factor transporter ATP-binding protein EcfA2